MMKTKVFRIRLSKRLMDMDRERVNDFKRNVIIKKSKWDMDDQFNFVNEIYTYEEKVDSEFHRDELDLYYRIKNWRLRKSREEEVYEFQILRDIQIDSLIEHKPSTVKELRKIMGIKKNRVWKYGKEILSIINSK